MSQQSNGRNVMVTGRIVWVDGDLFKGAIQTEYGNNKPKLDEQGQTIRAWTFGIAIPKSVLQQTGQGQPGEIWAAMHQEALSLYPSGQIPPSFAMKYKDEAQLDDKGIPFGKREGYEGCIVVTMSTRIPLKFFKHEAGQYIQINEGIKCGDYVSVQVNIKAHGAIGQGKAGLYVNPNAVLFVGFGKEIINTPSAESIFGATPPPMPMGASATPIAPAGFIVPPSQMQPQAPAIPGMATQGMPMIPQQPMAPAQPHYGVLPGQFQQQPQQGNVSNAPAAANGYPMPGMGGQPVPAQMPGNVGIPGQPTGYPPANAPTAAYPGNPGAGMPMPGMMPAYPQQ